MARAASRDVVILGARRKAKLEAIVRAPSSPQALARRARIALLAHAGWPNARIAAELGCTQTTVRTWRRRFARRGMPALADRPRSGRPPGLTGASATATTGAGAHHGSSFSFALVPSPNIAACLPEASGKVTITPGGQNDSMKVSISGMPAHAGFDLFVIQQPLAPFGVSWYQSDVNADGSGDGSATVRGVFDVETFSVSPGGTTTFSPTHQYHLGLWFTNPQTPFKLGCEPGATSPTVTPFNGEQHAGVQALNTSEFPANAGPLSHVGR